MDITGNSSNESNTTQIITTGDATDAKQNPKQVLMTPNPTAPKVIPRPSPATPRTRVMHVKDFNRPTCCVQRVRAKNVIRNVNGSVVTLNYHLTKVTFAQKTPQRSML